MNFKAKDQREALWRERERWAKGLLSELGLGMMVGKVLWWEGYGKDVEKWRGVPTQEIEGSYSAMMHLKSE